MSRPLVWFALLGCLSACSTATSSDIRTSGLYAAISGTSKGTGSTEVSATLTVGALSTTFVEIAGEDSLTASCGSDNKKLAKFALFGLVSYSATLPGDEEGKAITVALTRGALDTSAPRSVVTLPAKFNLTAPAAGATFARGKDPIQVGWNNPGKPDTMTVTLSGSCIQEVSRTVSGDPGSLEIAAADLKASKDNETKSCDVTVTVKRTRDGTLDPAYGKGGTVSGIQARSVSVKSGP